MGFRKNIRTKTLDLLPTIKGIHYLVHITVIIFFYMNPAFHVVLMANIFLASNVWAIFIEHNTTMTAMNELIFTSVTVRPDVYFSVINSNLFTVLGLFKNEGNINITSSSSRATGVRITGKNLKIREMSYSTRCQTRPFPNFTLHFWGRSRILAISTLVFKVGVMKLHRSLSRL